MGKSKVYTIALLGFNADERETIRKIFELLQNSQRSFYYSLAPERLTTMPDGFFVDTENAAAIAYWQRLHEHQPKPAVSIGQVVLDPAIAHASRPISFRAIKLLDRAIESEAANAKNDLLAERAITGAVTTKERRKAITQTSADLLPERRQGPERRKAPRTSKERRTGERRTDSADSNVVPLHAKGEMPKNEEGTSTILHALIVDDSLVVRNFLKTKIASPRITIDFAETGEQALELVKQRRFGLIFLDVVMPGIDGYDTCKRIRKIPGYGDARIVMITGRDGAFDKIKGTMAGCDAYLTKPVDQVKLKKLVEDSLTAARKAAAKQNSG